MIDPTPYLDMLNNPNATSADKLAAIDELNGENLSWWVNDDLETVSLIDWSTKRQLMATPEEE